MSDAKSPPELSIEEILATIRRIIAEDEQSGVSSIARNVEAGAGGGEERAADSATGGQSDEAAAKPAALQVDDSDDILELTEAVNEDGTTRHLAPIGGASARRPAALREAAAAVRPEPSLLRPDRPAARPAAAADERLISDAAARAAAGLTRPTDRLDPREPPRSGERTLEEIVTDLLRPLLQTWLDQNMPDMAERLLQAEISRIIGRSGPD